MRVPPPKMTNLFFKKRKGGDLHRGNTPPHSSFHGEGPGNSSRKERRPKRIGEGESGADYYAHRISSRPLGTKQQAWLGSPKPKVKTGTFGGGSTGKDATRMSGSELGD